MRATISCSLAEAWSCAAFLPGPVLSEALRAAHSNRHVTRTAYLQRLPMGTPPIPLLIQNVRTCYERARRSRVIEGPDVRNEIARAALPPRCFHQAHRRGARQLARCAGLRKPRKPYRATLHA